jgi:hypothetical protein
MAVYVDLTVIPMRRNILLPCSTLKMEAVSSERWYLPAVVCGVITQKTNSNRYTVCCKSIVKSSYDRVYMCVWEVRLIGAHHAGIVTLVPVHDFISTLFRPLSLLVKASPKEM